MFFEDLDNIQDLDELMKKMNEEEICPECVQCGYCCKQNPCYYGKWNYDKKQCEYLTDDNKCSKYNEIKEYEEKLGSEVKLFESGCCLNHMNPDRLKKLEK